LFSKRAEKAERGEEGNFRPAYQSNTTKICIE
jgi:hypothetical protein